MFLQSSEVCRIYITISNHVLYRWWHIFCKKIVCKKIVSKFWWQLELEKIRAKQLSESDWRNYCIVGLFCQLRGILNFTKFITYKAIGQKTLSECWFWWFWCFWYFLCFLAFYTCKNRTFSFFRISWYKLHMKFTCLRWSGMNLNIDLEKTFPFFSFFQVFAIVIEQYSNWC